VDRLSAQNQNTPLETALANQQKAVVKMLRKAGERG
jgi:ankyrin repeat protein